MQVSGQDKKVLQANASWAEKVKVGKWGYNM